LTTNMKLLTTAAYRQTGFPDHTVRIQYESSCDGKSDYAFYVPPLEGTRLISIHLHGHGSHGDQLFTRKDIAEGWLPVLRKYGCGLLSPNLRDDAWMSPAAARDLRELIAFVRAEYEADRFVIVTGSMGGTAALIYAALHPEDISGIVAACPATDIGSYHGWCRQNNTGILKEIADAIEDSYGGTPDTRPDVYAAHSALRNADRLTMPGYLIHGDADSIIPVEQSRQLANGLTERPDFRYREIRTFGQTVRQLS
jgi:pimeloyl-ACP methyl ester carboxylesterase